MKNIVRSKHRVAGFTLTEMAISIAIIGLILGAIWAAASMVYGNKATSRAYNEIIQVYNGYKALFNAKVPDATENTDITNVGINNGVFPSEMLTGTPPSQTAVGPWDNSTVVVTDQISQNAITVAFNGLGKSTCVRLGTTLSDVNNPAVIQLNINGTVGGTISPPALTASTVAAACSASGASNTLKVMLQF